MKPKDILTNPETRKQLAQQLGTSQQYLYQIATNRRRPSPAFSRKLEQVTGIHRSNFRPDIWD